MKAPRYKGLRPRSTQASAAAKGASRKKNTRCELSLRKALWSAGLRYRLDAKDLPGRPDIVFRKAKVAIFVDGDFWHGRDLRKRFRRLVKGHNADYWTKKLRANVERDRFVNKNLRGSGWCVMRFWESDIQASATDVAARIVHALGLQRRDRD